MSQKPVSIEISIRNWSIFCCFTITWWSWGHYKCNEKNISGNRHVFLPTSDWKKEKQIKASTVKSSETGKKRKTKLRATAKEYIDKENNEEGETYKSAEF